MYICVMCIRKYECMHCIILYFVATCKRPFGPLLLNKMKWNVSCYQTRCRWQYYLPFSNTAHVCTSAWCAQHSATATAQNSQLRFSWAMASTGHNWIDWIQDLESLQQREYELKVNKIKEIKQRVIDLWPSSTYNWIELTQRPTGSLLRNIK